VWFGLGRVEPPQLIDKCAAPAPSIVPVQFEPLEEDQHPQDVRVPGFRNAQALLFPFPKLGQRVLKGAAHIRRDHVGRHGLVINAALQGPICSDQGLESLPHVEINSAALECRRR